MASSRRVREFLRLLRAADGHSTAVARPSPAVAEIGQASSSLPMQAPAGGGAQPIRAAARVPQPDEPSFPVM